MGMMLKRKIRPAMSPPEPDPPSEDNMLGYQKGPVLYVVRNKTCCLVPSHAEEEKKVVKDFVCVCPVAVGWDRDGIGMVLILSSSSAAADLPMKAHVDRITLIKMPILALCSK